MRLLKEIQEALKEEKFTGKKFFMFHCSNGNITKIEEYFKKI